MSSCSASGGCSRCGTIAWAVDVLRGRVMPAWGSVFFSGGQHTCFIVHAGMITYPAARFIHLAAADPALPSRYRNDIDEMQAALLETVDGFAHEWHDGPGAQEGYFTDTALGGRHLPVNQQNCLGRTMLLLAAPAGRPDYRARTAQLAHFLRRRLVLMPDGAYVWQYHPPIAPPFAASPAEDISHGAMNVDFAALCHRHGVVFDDEDMARFGRTFLQRVCQEAGRFADSVDGSGEEHRYADVIAYWGHLARTTPDVLAVLRQHYLRRDPPVRGPLALLALAMLGFYTPGS